MISESISRQILLVGPDYKNHRGGIGAVIAVHKDQYEVFNFIPSYRPYKNNLVKSFFFLRQLITIIIRLSKNRNIKIVHIHSSKEGSFYRKLLIACLVKWVFRRKTINHIHSGNFKRFYDNSNGVSQKVIRYFLKLNDVTFTVSEFWKEYFETLFDLQNVYSIKNIVTAPLSSLPLKSVSNGFVSFLFLGLIDPNKGVFDLLKVLSDNKLTLQNRFKLIIAGNGNVDLLLETINGNDLKELVAFKGWVTGEAKQQLLRTADVFILPSYYEGLPVSVLEAMSYGKPVISTSVGGIPEIVRQGFNGILNKPGDLKELLSAILYYMNDRENITRHGNNSFQIIKEYYPESIMPKLEAVYTSLL